MDNKFVYIENVHNAPITCVYIDASGKKAAKKFYHSMSDKWTGRVVKTGFEKLSQEEYEALCKTSKAFNHFKDSLKKLVVHDEVPPELKGPGEALAEARRQTREAEKRIKELEGEVTELKAKLLDSETAYKTLQSASTDDEKVAPLLKKIAKLEAKLAKREGRTDKEGSGTDDGAADEDGDTTVEG